MERIAPYYSKLDYLSSILCLSLLYNRFCSLALDSVLVKFDV